jgi:hypothetical protein
MVYSSLGSALVTTAVTCHQSGGLVPNERHTLGVLASSSPPTRSYDFSVHTAALKLHQRKLFSTVTNLVYILINIWGFIKYLVSLAVTLNAFFIVHRLNMARPEDHGWNLYRPCTRNIFRIRSDTPVLKRMVDFLTGVPREPLSFGLRRFNMR